MNSVRGIPRLALATLTALALLTGLKDLVAGIKMLQAFGPRTQLSAKDLAGSNSCFAKD